MRISRWPVLLCAGLLAIVGQTANAFDSAYESAIAYGGYETAEDDGADYFDDSSEYGGFVGTDGFGFQPVQYVEDGSGGMPMYGGGDPYSMQGGYPPNAWPGVSPYTQHNMEGVYNEGGVWRYEANDDERKHVFSTEFLLVWGLRPGSHIIGDSQYTNVTYTRGTNSDRSRRDPSFPLQNSSQYSNLTHYGVKLRYGWENPDESAIMLSGFFVAPNAADKDATGGPGRQRGRFRNLINPGQIDPTASPRQGLASIAYSDAAIGNLALFDRTFTQTYDQEVWGTDVDGYFAPFFRRNSFRLAASLGAKWIRLSETYTIRGSSSGDPQLNTEINASSTSNFIGPSIGLRYDLGGNKFKLWGQTKVAVAANLEDMQVAGRNAFANANVSGGSGSAFYIPPPPYNVTFNNKRSNAHLSPIIDQSIYGEFPLFALLPIVNRISLINQANFRIGYNFLVINDVQRPANMIRYTAFDPTVRTNRTWFSLTTVSFAADWRF